MSQDEIASGAPEDGDVCNLIYSFAALSTNERSCSREEAILEIASYYDFLVRLYLSTDCIKNPPPGGWPQIIEDSYRETFRYRD